MSDLSVLQPVDKQLLTQHASRLFEVFNNISLVHNSFTVSIKNLIHICCLCDQNIDAPRNMFFLGGVLTLQVSGLEFESSKPIKILGGYRSSLVILLCSGSKDRIPRVSWLARLAILARSGFMRKTFPQYTKWNEAFNNT